mgnify:CR=1 FL=1
MKLKAEVLSPVHIGSGRNLTPFDYVVNAGFINYDLTGLLGHEPGITDKIIGGLGKSKSNYFLQSLLDSEQITDPEYWTYKLPASGGVEHNLGRHHPDVDEYVKTATDEAYLPGSSVKGGLRTAFTYKLLKYHKSRFTELAEKDFRNLEQDLYAGGSRDAKKDFWKAILVSDSGAGDPGDLMTVSISRVLSASHGRGKFKYWNYYETLREGESLELTATVDSDFLSSGKVKRTTPWSEDLRDTSLTDLLSATREFGIDICKEELKYYRNVQNQDTGEVEEFYEGLLDDMDSADEDEGYICIGQGIGWIKTTIGMLLKYADPVDFKRFRKRNHLATHRMKSSFPKTRRVITGGPEYPVKPFGWLKLSIEEDR